MKDLKTIIEAFYKVSENPRAQLDKVLADGRKAVGVIPYFAPEELVYAAGMVPFGMWGAETQVSESKRYFPAFYCSIVHAALDLGIKGAYDGLSAVMVPLTCDALKGMGPNWSFGVKNIPVIDVAYAQNRKIKAGTDFTESQFRKIKAKLEEISGSEITDEACAKANRVYNENRRTCLEFTELSAKHSKSVSPEDRAAVLKARYFMARDCHTAMVKELNEALSALPEEKAELPIVTTGILADSPKLLEILKENGFSVAADQVAHESVEFRVLADETTDPVRAIAERIARINGTSVLYDPEKQRGKELVSLAKSSGSCGVLWILTKFCDPEEFDLVPVKAMLDAAGIPLLTIETDQQMVNYEQIRTAIETFREML